MALQLVAKFDVFSSEHVARYGNCGRGHVSYLSFATCNEFIDILSEKVLQKIVFELRETKYFTISADPTCLYDNPLEFLASSFQNYQLSSSSRRYRSVCPCGTLWISNCPRSKVSWWFWWIREADYTEREHTVHCMPVLRFYRSFLKLNVCVFEAYFTKRSYNFTELVPPIT
jgi:hypothetical protein